MYILDSTADRYFGEAQRIKGNSLRLRVSRSEVESFLQTGRIEETIHFGSGPETGLIYALEHTESLDEISVRYQSNQIAVLLSCESAHRWADSPAQVGVYGNFAVCGGELALLVEKDFACLDGTDADSEDYFPNPNVGIVC